MREFCLASSWLSPFFCRAISGVRAPETSRLINAAESRRYLRNRFIFSPEQSVYASVAYSHKRQGWVADARAGPARLLPRSADARIVRERSPSRSTPDRSEVDVFLTKAWLRSATDSRATSSHGSCRRILETVRSSRARPPDVPPTFPRFGVLVSFRHP